MTEFLIITWESSLTAIQFDISVKDDSKELVSAVTFIYSWYMCLYQKDSPELGFAFDT